MIHGLDSVTVAVADVGAAAEAYGALLGRPPNWPNAGEARFQLSNTALFLVQADAAEGLKGFTFAVGDLAAARTRLDRLAIPSLDPADAGDRVRLEVEATCGLAMALVERPAPPQAGEAAPDAVAALDHAVVATTHPNRAAALYGARLGLDFRLDRTNPQWGSRLMFFRCGEAVIEVSADLAVEASDAPDRLTGLAWRVADPDAARARIAAAGFDVSPVRAGRKPGTRVFTVRSGVVGAPTLMIGQ